MNRKPSS